MANKENMRKWVAALRSGKYEQNVGRLLSRGLLRSGKYCCLGVACEVAIANGVKLNKVVTRHVNSGSIGGYDGDWVYLPWRVRAWLGLSEEDPVIATRRDSYDRPFSIRATQANDGLKWSFAQIADAIEQFYELEDGGNDGE